MDADLLVDTILTKSLQLVFFSIFQRKVLHYVVCSVIGGDNIIDNDSNQLETQRKGVVVVYFPSPNHVQNNFSLARGRARAETFGLFLRTIPVRVVSIHFCLPDIPWVRTLSSVLVLSKLAPRSKYHFGNNLEIRYQLQGYGLPTELIPNTDTGNVKKVNLKQWIKLRMYLDSQIDGDNSSGDDASMSSSSQSAPPMHKILDCPGSKDVVFRRGKAMNHHPGNAIFMNLIEERIYEHTIDPDTDHSRRLELELELIEKVKQDGGRFLKWDIDKGWLVDMSPGSDKEIQTKVHYAFRDFRKKMLRPKPVANHSSTYAFAYENEQQKRKRCCNIQLPNENPI